MKDSVTTPKTVTVAVTQNWGSEPITRVEVDCFYRNGSLAVTRGVYSDGWRITQLPTGYSIDPRFTNKALAKKFCIAISEIYDWSKITDPKKVKRMYALKKKVNLVRKRLKLEIKK